MPNQPYAPTGRAIPGPVEDLIELHRGGHASLAIAHRPAFHDAALVDEVLDLGGPFLRSPMVAGLVELDQWERSAHQLIYPTGRVTALAELLAAAQQRGRPLGARAGLELAYQGALILQEAGAAGEGAGLPLHGDPTPWRWMLDTEGGLHLIGWGVPALELYKLDAEPGFALPTDAWRYLPPERIRAEREDATSDLFTLALVAAEAILGAPVYDGAPSAVRAQAQRADTERRLFALSDALTADQRRVLARALDPYPDGRHTDAEDFIRAVHDLLYAPNTEGPTLAQVATELAPRLAPIPAPPAEGADRWQPVARERRAPGVGERPAADVDAPPTDRIWAMGTRATDPTRPTSSAAALHQDLRRSQQDRDARLRERLGSSATAHRAMLRDRTGLFPTLPIAGEALRYLVEPPDGGQVWAQLGPDETLASSAARVIDQCRHTPVGPTGQIEGWYRLTQGGAAWYGCTQTRVLDASKPVQLEYIPNRAVAVSVAIHDDEPPVQIEVGTAVHAAFLVNYLRARFGLRARDWALFADADRPLDAWQVLDDFDLAPGAALQLRRTGRTATRARRA